MIILGFGHVARSGKDAAADYLVHEHGFRKASFISGMKEACRVIFGFNDDQLYGKLKEVPDPFWNARLDLRGTNGDRLTVTPRVIMQLMGTEAGRNVFGQDLWVLATMRHLQNSGHDRWVISDVRFPNEAGAILDAGGSVYRIDRPGAGATNGVAAHPSETALLGYSKWTGIIANDGTLEQLYAKADSLVQKGP